MHIRKHPLHPAKNLSSSDDQLGVLARESQILISCSRSDSPQSPLVVERGLFSSNNGGHSSEEDEEEEEKSDGRSSCRIESKKKRQVLNLQLSSFA